MGPFAKVIHRQAGEHGVAVWSVLHRFRGWNDADMSPVHDARWALEQVRQQHGDVPVVLLGHSMGGRTAVRVLDDPSVVAMVGLAPWLPDEPVEVASDRTVAIVHGTSDHTTSPRQTRRWADQARPLARSVVYVRMRHAGHFLLRRVGLWTDLATGFTLTFLGLEPRIGTAATKVLSAAHGGEDTLTV